MHTRQTDVNKRGNDGNIVQLTVLIYLHAKLTSYILNFYVFVHVNVLAAKAAKAVEEKDGETVLKLLSESGKSSWELLQNCYPIKAYTEQKISVALALTDLFLEKLGKGICRIHGGGFAGVIMCVVPEEETENYVSYISEFAGKENVYPMNIRAVGAVHIEK